MHHYKFIRYIRLAWGLALIPYFARCITEDLGKYKQGLVQTGSIWNEHKDALPSTQRTDLVEIAPKLNEHLDSLESGPSAKVLGAKPPYISTCSDKMNPQKFDIKITGFVKYDFFYDSRQIENEYLGLVQLAPKAPLYDPYGHDIHDKPQWNMLGLQSRVNLEIQGPPLGHAATTAFMCTDFLDFTNQSLVNLRFVYMQFNLVPTATESLKVLVGHYYHPTSLEEAYPETFGYSEGSMYDPFAYAPQITCRYTYDIFTLIGSINADWMRLAARNAVIPSLYLAGTIQFSGPSYIGAGVDYHREVPHIITPTGYSTSKALNSWLYYVFVAITKEGFRAKARFTYVENGIRYSMLGGYAPRERNFNPITMEGSYTNLRAVAAWTELIYRHKKAEFGVFAGYTKNIGAQHEIVTLPNGTADLHLIGTLYPSAARTNHIIKFQPRIKYYLDPIVFGLELEYCRASYGVTNRFGRVPHAHPQEDARIEFAIFYNF
jgi:hypothetical protein